MNPPPKPTDEAVARWMHYLERRFPNLHWEWHCRGEWVYLCINAPNSDYLYGLQTWLGGGEFAPCGLLYPIKLRPVRCN